VVEAAMTLIEGKRARILLVEDEPLICDLAAEALAEQGFAVAAMGTANEALQYLASDSPVDVLFTDVNLAGGMDGDALARLARELRPDLPVVYTSGRRSKIESMDPVEGSMFLAKPYDPYKVGPLFDYLIGADKISHPQVAGARA
jgi:CheY-like chemotaxis protein